MGRCRRTGPVGVVVAALVLLAGCASGPDGGVDAGDEGEGTVVQRVQAAIDEQSSVHLSIGGLAAPAKLEADLDLRREEGDLEVVERSPSDPEQFVVRRVDGDLFMSLGGDAFHAVSAASATGPSVAGVRDLMGDIGVTLDAVISAAEEGPDADVPGAVTSYRLGLDSTVLLRDQVEDSALGVLPGVELPATVLGMLWVDAAERPVRLEVRYFEALEEGDGPSGVRVDFSDWGAPVSVERPTT
ncbi:hypothetical protein E8D34_02045 [Nocardioides sp. GY 10113]|uniref:hypothetical protein n=1 Tax=Nocardioides sp. GY 10113 TaxID=2569761 RepID=UPI0010A8F63B|nr:hypothetical protein [Nocardioides sp. GY 10113]TIC89292.1 hypothetical protein E8D34_02045 [Nocardioides sp. GY 10113]